MSLNQERKKQRTMKKGLAIGLGIGGGILLIGAILGITITTNAAVRDFVKNQVDQVVNDDALDLRNTKIENVIELTKAEKAEQGVQADASTPGSASFQFHIKDLPAEVDANSVRLQSKIIRGDTKSAYFVATVGEDVTTRQYEGISILDNEIFSLKHDLFKKTASEAYTIRTYWIEHPSVYVDTKVTFSYEKEEVSDSSVANGEVYLPLNPGHPVYVA